MIQFRGSQLDNCASLPSFSAVDSYLFLIDESLQTLVQGVPFVCVNVALDAWQPIATVPIELLRQIAVRCVLQRVNQSRFDAPLDMPELQRYG